MIAMLLIQGMGMAINMQELIELSARLSECDRRATYLKAAIATHQKELTEIETERYQLREMINELVQSSMVSDGNN